MPAARTADEVALVLALKEKRWTDRRISDRTGVPVNTIRGWRRNGISLSAARILGGAPPQCPACGTEPHDFSALPGAVYAYLLGLYLGDGCVSRSGRGSSALRIALDEAYPGIVNECCDAIEQVRGRRPKPRRPHRDDHYWSVESTWKAWACFFPQHGPGKKHQRKIELADWQKAIVDAHPGRFVRGLIHSDGWRGINKVRVKGHDYEYPRYQVSNGSDDIRGLFTYACDLLGVAWRPWTRFHISVARADAVAILDRYVGEKR